MRDKPEKDCAVCGRGFTPRNSLEINCSEECRGHARAAQRRDWKQNNLEKKRAANRAWKAANPDKVNAYARAARTASPDKFRFRERAYRERNLDAYRSRKRAQMRERYTRDPEKAKDKTRDWCRRHPVTVAQWSARRASKQARDRRARRKQAALARSIAAWSALASVTESRDE